MKRGLDPSSVSTKLPRSLGEAIREFRENGLFKELMGQTFFEEYAKLKEYELELFDSQISEFEVENYGAAY